MIVAGDCLAVLPSLEAGSFDAIVTDPPYEIGFMTKAWDRSGIAFDPATWSAMLRVARPGAYLLAFGATRTVHRITVAIEDAGWSIRDVLIWAYATGYPKSKASLKPAYEPIVLARKPGASSPLQIDAARLPMSEQDRELIERAGGFMQAGWQGPDTGIYNKSGDVKTEYRPAERGRWPANVVLTDPIFDGETDGVIGGGLATPGHFPRSRPRSTFQANAQAESAERYLEAETYSRFFLVPKPSVREREPILSDLPRRSVPTAVLQTIGRRDAGKTIAGKQASSPRQNTHPTVKPLELMRHLIRLVTPLGGTVLDPFLGSGTTGIAAELEGFAWLGIEQDPESVEIAEARLAYVQRGIGL